MVSVVILNCIEKENKDYIQIQDSPELTEEELIIILNESYSER
jgi:hypothetical protein